MATVHYWENGSSLAGIPITAGLEQPYKDGKNDLGTMHQIQETDLRSCLIILACLALRSGSVPITNTGFYSPCKLLSDRIISCSRDQVG